MIFSHKTRYAVDTLGAEVLRQVAAPVTEINDEIRSLAKSMTDTMNVFDGIGLAAPQVGHSIRMVVLGVPMDAMSNPPSPGEAELLPRMPLVLINPEIISAGEEFSERDEGCLSVPDIFAPVLRPERIVFRAQTLDGVEISAECGGLLARCIQHELDHLDGKLFVDRVLPGEKKQIESAMRRLEKFGSKHHYKRVCTR